MAFATALFKTAILLRDSLSKDPQGAVEAWVMSIRQSARAVLQPGKLAAEQKAAAEAAERRAAEERRAADADAADAATWLGRIMAPTRFGA